MSRHSGRDSGQFGSGRVARVGVARPSAAALSKIEILITCCACVARQPANAAAVWRAVGTRAAAYLPIDDCARRDAIIISIVSLARFLSVRLAASDTLS